MAEKPVLNPADTYEAVARNQTGPHATAYQTSNPSVTLDQWLWTKHPQVARAVGGTGFVALAAFVVWLFTR